MGDAVAPLLGRRRVGRAPARAHDELVALPRELEGHVLVQGRRRAQGHLEQLVRVGDARLGVLGHLREEEAAGERAQPRAVARRGHEGQADAHRAPALLAHDDGVVGVEGHVDRRRRVRGQVLLEGRPVRLLGVGDDELEAPPERVARLAQRHEGVEQAGEGPLVVLHAAPHEAAGLARHVHLEGALRPLGRVGGLHVAVGHETQALGRVAEADDDHGTVVDEVEAVLVGEGPEPARHGLEARVLGVGRALAVIGVEGHELGEARLDGLGGRALRALGQAHGPVRGHLLGGGRRRRRDEEEGEQGSCESRRDHGGHRIGSAAPRDFPRHAGFRHPSATSHGSRTGAGPALQRSASPLKHASRRGRKGPRSPDRRGWGTVSPPPRDGTRTTRPTVPRRQPDARARHGAPPRTPRRDPSPPRAPSERSDPWPRARAGRASSS